MLHAVVCSGSDGIAQTQSCMTMEHVPTHVNNAVLHLAYPWYNLWCHAVVTIAHSCCAGAMSALIQKLESISSLICAPKF